MADKNKFSKSPKNKKGFQFTGLEPKMEYKGNPYVSIKDTDTEVDMKDMAAVFSKGDDDGFTDVLIGPKRAGIRIKKKFFKGGLVRSGKPKIATKGWR
jgi:hypothetical protein